ncbi:MAG: hypothetical protein QM642_10835 [Edaphocola sp.]
MHKYLLRLFVFLVHFAYPNGRVCANQLQNDSIFVYSYGKYTDTIKFIDNFSKITIQSSDNKKNATYYPSGLNEIPKDIIVGKELIIVSTDDDRFLNAKWIELRFFGTERILKLSRLNNEKKFNMLPEVPIIETDIHYPVGLNLRSDIIDKILVQEKKEYKNTTIRFDNAMQDFQEFIDFYSEYSEINNIPFKLTLREYMKKCAIVNKDVRNYYYKLLFHLREEKDFSSYKYLNKLIRKSKKEDTISCHLSE